MKKLTCHCGGVEAGVNVPEKGFETNTAKHYFCSNCGIHTHNRPRSNPKIYGVNIACVDGIKPFEIENVPINDGENHPLDQKK